jgi:2,3-bisphosphoglycerate-dependent phosphoglycerate mutase
MKTIYLVRHCKADGQAPEAALTEEGREQAERLARFFENRDIEYLISSPYTRAIDTARPLSGKLGIPIHVEERLSERVLSASHMEDWMERLEETYKDRDLSFEGGESSNEAMRRGAEVIREAEARTENHIVLFTHGGLLSLLIQTVDQAFGFEQWKKLSNPDIYQLTTENGESVIKRIWQA